MSDYTTAEIYKFWSRVKVTENLDECWEWQAARHTNGYGHFTHRKVTKIASRVAWELFKGEIPEGMLICHHCDNPPCCNPRHLFIGTYQDNASDRVNKGRGRSLTGENINNKLLTEQVLAIRFAYAQGGITLTALARQYGCGYTTIHSIVTRRTWKHI